jgi:hypothetical protein
VVLNGSVSGATYVQNELQNGTIVDLNVSFERALAPGTGISTTVSATRQTARDPGYATTAGAAALLGWHELKGATLFASVGLRRIEGDARLFPFITTRRDWLLSARAGATLRQLAISNFAPLLRLSFERSTSTVAIYEYRRLAGEIGVVRAF